MKREIIDHNPFNTNGVSVFMWQIELKELSNLVQSDIWCWLCGINIKTDTSKWKFWKEQVMSIGVYWRYSSSQNCYELKLANRSIIEKFNNKDTVSVILYRNQGTGLVSMNVTTTAMGMNTLFESDFIKANSVVSERCMEAVLLNDLSIDVIVKKRFE